MTNRTAHVIGIVIVWAFALCFGWFYASGVHFRTVAFICSGFVRIGNDHPPVIPPIVIGMVGKIAGHVMVTPQEWPAGGDRNAAHRAGCDFFLPKPYDLATVATLVAGLMSARPQPAGRLPLNFAPQSR
jgi:hypothetical protein